MGVSKVKLPLIESAWEELAPLTLAGSGIMSLSSVVWHRKHLLTQDKVLEFAFSFEADIADPDTTVSVALPAPAAFGQVDLPVALTLIKSGGEPETVFGTLKASTIDITLPGLVNFDTATYKFAGSIRYEPAP